ncbi:alpha/beta hydrolase [Amycolatopsis acidicola]|uniref:Alpha/beta hydrolase n=1 Tax=Amycolatopsis acidicola TaxID=2596893 RepID=A0A5N0V2W7_9PSEU|nr:alpha/beta hydrolase [Amycolatopsis acidicola]KAA9160716.1 alpha/beta hydrolase [Amycolatopsis acidicola]
MNSETSELQDLKETVGEGRSLPDAKEWLYAHLKIRRNPFSAIDVEAATRVIGDLRGTDPETWAEDWTRGAGKFAAAAVEAAERGDREAARGAYFQAYVFSAVGRYPSPVHPAKLACYDRAREYFGQAMALESPPVERVEVPFRGRAGEGEKVVFHVARPAGVTHPPVVMMWGGIDVWKEESYARGRLLREHGFATLHVDMPGVGEAPVLASADAERMWEPVFGWLADSDLDAGRCAALGLSFGGYWAMKLAYVHKDELAAAVNWGGGVHLTFQPEWQEKSRNASSYLMDLMATRARIFGGHTFADYVARCPELSLLDQGLLDRPSAPLLMVNGVADKQNSSDDIPLSLRYGDPKTARMFPGGHMGEGPVMPTIVTWLCARLQPTVPSRTGESS